MSKPFLIAICAGLISLLAALPALNGAPGGLLLFYFAGLPIYMAGLAFGAAAGTVATMSGFVAAAVFGGAMVAGVFALVHLLPAWAVVRQAMMQRTDENGQTEWLAPGVIVVSLTGMAATMLAAGSLALMVEGTGMSVVVSEQLNGVLANLTPDVSGSAREDAVRQWAPLLPASAGSSWIIMALVSAGIAQALLTRLGRNVRPTPEYSALTLPDWISWALVGAAVLALVTGGEFRYLARNMALILAVPFFLLGLAVIHQWTRRRPRGTLTLFLVYIFILFVGWAGLLVTTAIGVLEQWAGIRHRFAGTGPQDLNE